MNDSIILCILGGIAVVSSIVAVWLFVLYTRQNRELAVLMAGVEHDGGERDAALSRLRLATRSTLDALPHAVAVLSADGKIDLANRLAESLFKLQPEVDASPKWLTDLLEQARRTGAAVAGKSMQVFEGGEELFFTPRAAPILQEGKLVGILVLLENATELRQVEEAKSGLLAMVSHELKTPLTSIQMAIHLLIDNPKSSFSAKERELLQTAGEDAERLNGLIQRLLDKGRR